MLVPLLLLLLHLKLYCSPQSAKAWHVDQIHCCCLRFGRLVSVPDIISDLSHPFLSPVCIIVPSGIGSRAFGKPALARQLHTQGIRPRMAWLPRIFGIAHIVPLPICTPFKRNKKLCSTVTGLTVFLDEGSVFQITVNVDLMEQCQALACKPHSVVVELISHLFVVKVPVLTIILIFVRPIPRITSVTVA